MGLWGAGQVVVGHRGGGGGRTRAREPGEVSMSQEGMCGRARSWVQVRRVRAGRMRCMWGRGREVRAAMQRCSTTVQHWDEPSKTQQLP